MFIVVCGACQERSRGCPLDRREGIGIIGHGECSDGRDPCGVVSTVHEFEAILIGRDPRPIEMRYWDMYRMTRQSPGGIGLTIPHSVLLQADHVIQRPEEHRRELAGFLRLRVEGEGQGTARSWRSPG